MKKFLNPVSLLLIIFFFQSLSQIKAQIVETGQEQELHELMLNEVDTFSNGPLINYTKYNCWHNRGSYDNTRYHIAIDSTGKLNVSDIRECNGKHQNELEIINCSGTLSRNSDTVIISAKTIYTKFYLFTIKKNGINDSFDPNVRIKLISRTLKNEYCPSLAITDNRVQIIALPKNVDTDEIYEAIHRDKTIGIFTYFVVSDSNGKSKSYPAGDYVLIGGNSLNITK